MTLNQEIVYLKVRGQSEEEAIDFAFRTYKIAKVLSIHTKPPIAGYIKDLVPHMFT